MGLVITNPVRVLGLDLPGLYLRFKIDHYFTGIIDVHVNIYASKEAYQENINNHFQIEGIKNHYQFSHDRMIDSVDILQFIHDRITEILTTDKITGDGKDAKIIKEKFVDKAKIACDLKTAK